MVVPVGRKPGFGIRLLQYLAGLVLEPKPMDLFFRQSTNETNLRRRTPSRS